METLYCVYNVCPFFFIFDVNFYFQFLRSKITFSVKKIFLPNLETQQFTSNLVTRNSKKIDASSLHHIPRLLCMRERLYIRGILSISLSLENKIPDLPVMVVFSNSFWFIFQVYSSYSVFFSNLHILNEFIYAVI